MALSTDLIKEFVEITNDQTENKQETTVYGTIALHGGQRYVRIDGSDLLTPVKSTVDAIPGDRVTVLIKDHSVIVNGSTSSPSARKSGLDAVNDHIDATFDATGRITNSKINVMETNINTVNSEISTLNSDVYIEDSETHIKSSRIEALETDVGLNKSSIQGINTQLLVQNSTIQEIGSTVNTQQSSINTLNSTVTTQGSQINTQGSQIGIINSVFTIEDGVIKKIKGINANFAHIDFADIDTASIEELFASSGIIKDLVTDTGSITGELVGVTIKGDMIEAGTLVADKLVIKGEDGLYYKLNTAGKTAFDIPWDGNTEGLKSITDQVYKVISKVDDIASKDDLIGAKIEVVGIDIPSPITLSENDISSTEDGRVFICSVDGEPLVFVAIEDGEVNSMQFTKGVWFTKTTEDAYVSRLYKEVTIETEQTDYNSLNGSIITAKSITAEKVNVSDLVAFGATIGGFHITENSIFSGAKSAIDNENNGMYMDTDGQLYLGDSNNYIKYYKDSNDQYHLKISAEDLEFVNSTYFRLNDDGLLIGRKDSPIQLLETNDKLSFKNVQTDEEYAYISSDGFNTSSLKIENKTVADDVIPGRAIFGGYEVSISDGVIWNWVG